MGVAVAGMEDNLGHCIAHALCAGAHSAGCLYHIARLHPVIELGLTDAGQLQRGLFQRAAGLLRMAGDAGRLVITEVRTEGGHQHQGLVQLLGDALAVGFQPGNAMRGQAVHAITQQAQALQKVVGNQRLEDIQFEVA